MYLENHFGDSGLGPFGPPPLLHPKNYCFITYIVFVSASPHSGCFPLSRFPVHSLIFTPKFLFFSSISSATWGSTFGTAHDARGSMCG